MRPSLRWVAAVVVLAGPAAGQGPNTLTDEERAAGWVLLFDGRSTTGWRGYGQPVVPSGWAVVDGALTRVGGGGDLITTGQYADFELALEWNISRGGNSGIFIRGAEAPDPETVPIFRSALEMQVLDDAGHPDGQSRLTAAGSIFGLYPAPPGIARPPGQWNEVRIVARGDRIAHWLNGSAVADFQVGSQEWLTRIGGSKFASWPGFGRATRGHIGLQDHGDRVAYRNIKLRPLTPSP